MHRLKHKVIQYLKIMLLLFQLRYMFLIYMDLMLWTFFYVFLGLLNYYKIFVFYICYIISSIYSWVGGMDRYQNGGGWVGINKKIRSYFLLFYQLGLVFYLLLQYFGEI
jgi:hypothetical protein